jgi:hypothetical protein
MIKQAEVQNAYLLGRQAAMEKLAGMSPAGPLAEGQDDVLTDEQVAAINELNRGIGANTGNYMAAVGGGSTDPAAQLSLWERARMGLGDTGAYLNELRQGIGLGGRGLSRNQQTMAQDFNKDLEGPPIQGGGDPYAAYNPMNYATLENLSRAGMLGGALGGSALGGMDPRAAALASAGALGGGFAGGGLGQAAAAGLAAYRGQGDDALRQQLTAGGGALGGLAGGLGAGYAAR